MTDKKINVNISKLRIIADKWKEALIPGNNIDPNKLADFTLKIINEEPLIRDICDAFLFSLSIKLAKDPNFDPATYKKIDKDVDKDIAIKGKRDVKRYKK
jgi:hypothetical protein